MSQFARPNTTRGNDGGWTSTEATLHDALNSIAIDDTSYIESPGTAAGGASDLGLSTIDPPGIGTVTARYRVRRTAANRSWTIVVILYSGDTQVASWETANPGTAFATTTQTLTAGQRDLITDWSDLHVTVNNTVAQANTVGFMSWFELEAPEGDVSRSGSIAVNESPDTVIASGTVSTPPITGIVAFTNQDDSLNSNGEVLGPSIIGSVAFTNQDDSLNSNGTVSAPSITGSIAFTESPDTVVVSGNIIDGLSIIGAVYIFPYQSITYDNNNVTWDSDPANYGSFAPDKLSATGTFTPPTDEITGSLNVTEQDDELNAAGVVIVPKFIGTVTIIEFNDTLSASGTSIPPLYTGIIAVEEEDDTVNAVGTVTPPTYSGSIGITEAPDTFDVTGTVVNTELVGNVTLVEQNDSISATGNVSVPIISGTVSITEINDDINIQGNISVPIISGTVSITELADTIAISGTLPIPIYTGIVEIVENNDVIIASGTVLQPGVVARNITVEAGTAYVIDIGTATRKNAISVARLKDLDMSASYTILTALPAYVKLTVNTPRN